MIGEVGIITDRLPVMALLSWEARMPLLSCEMRRPVRLSSSVVWIGALEPRRHHNLLWRWAGAPLNCGGLAGAMQP
jgi:hypothetical protein